MTAKLEHPFFQSTKQMADFLDAIPVSVYRTTLEGEIVYCNTALAKTFGYNATSELIGNQVTQLYQQIKDRGNLIQQILTRRRLNNYVVALKRKDGRPIWCSVTAQTGLDDDDMIIHLDGIVRDVTNEVTAGNKRPEAGHSNQGVNGGQNEKFKGVLEMAGGVAHLFNQPLTVATNLVNELVEEIGKSTDQTDKLLKIQSQIGKLNEITRKIANIHKYASMDYVAGVKIVDIDNASLS